jgi:hypothetical protein
MATNDYSYQNCIETSERIAWTIESVLGGAGFDFEKAFLPESLARVQNIVCLSDKEKLRLNQIRGLTYAHLFGFVEEFIVRKVVELAASYPMSKAVERRALLRFAEEETKHQLLFERTKASLLNGLGDCGLVPGAGDVAGVVLSKSELGVLLLISMLEWMTQHHYIDIFSSGFERESLDPTFTQIFKAHWIEEAQHTKLDHLEIERVARSVDPGGREAAIDELLEIGGAFDGLLEAQAKLDLESLQRLTGRALSDKEKDEILSKQHKAYRWTFLGSALRHPKFNALVAALTKSGAAKIEQAAAAMSA